MPNYGTAQCGGQITSLAPGESLALFLAESPTAPQASISFSRCQSPVIGGIDDTTFTISFAAPPTAAVTIQGANQDIDGQYITLYTSTNTQLDYYTDTGRWRFYRGKLVSYSAGGALTMIAQR